MRRLLLYFCLLSFALAPAFGAELKSDWDKYLWCAAFATDTKDAETCVARIMSNYNGPGLSSIAAPCQLAEFVRKPDGGVSWIYHPERLNSVKLVSPEIRSAMDVAIQKSAPYPSLGFIPECTFALMYDPKRTPSVWLGGSDRPSPVGALVSKDGLQKWDADAWTQANSREIEKNFQFPKGVAKNMSAAYWVSLNPDGSIHSKAPVSVSTGSGSQSKQVAIVKQSLQRAIARSRLVYKGAPVVDNQPVGMVVLYRPTGTLHVFPYLFDVQPYLVKWIK